MTDFFGRQSRAMLERFATENAELRAKLDLEIAKRIAAETLSEERRRRLEEADILIAQANDRANDVTHAQLSSLNLVNTELLKALAPEPSVLKPGEFKPVLKQKRQAVTSYRAQEREAVSKAVKANSLVGQVNAVPKQ